MGLGSSAWGCLSVSVIRVYHAQGTFLVRPSLSLAGAMVLSVVVGGVVKHMALDGNQLDTRSLEVPPHPTSTGSVEKSCCSIQKRLMHVITAMLWDHAWRCAACRLQLLALCTATAAAHLTPLFFPCPGMDQRCEGGSGIIR